MKRLKIKNLDEKQEDKPLSMAVGYELGDGKIVTSCWNNQAEIAEAVTTVGCKYSGSAAIEPDAMASKGSGESENNAGEIYHLVYIENEGKWAWIELNQEGKSINYQWKKVAKASLNNTFIGVALKTNAENGEVVTEVVGEASEFPRQHLPPGRFVIYNYPVHATTTTDSSTNEPTPVYVIPEFGPPEGLIDLQEFFDLTLNGDDVQDSGIGASSDQEPTEPQEEQQSHSNSNGTGFNNSFHRTRRSKSACMPYAGNRAS